MLATDSVRSAVGKDVDNYQEIWTTLASARIRLDDFDLLSNTLHCRDQNRIATLTAGNRWTRRKIHNLAGFSWMHSSSKPSDRRPRCGSLRSRHLLPWYS